MKKLLFLLIMAGFSVASFAQKPTITFSVSANSFTNTITVFTSQPLPEQVTILFQYQAENNTTGYAFCTLLPGACEKSIYPDIVNCYDSAYFYEVSINNLTYDVTLLGGCISTALADYIFPGY